MEPITRVAQVGWVFWKATSDTLRVQKSCGVIRTPFNFFNDAHAISAYDRLLTISLHIANNSIFSHTPTYDIQDVNIEKKGTHSIMFIFMFSFFVPLIAVTC